MSFNCLCDKCTRELRYGAEPYDHYKPSKVSTLEKEIYRLIKKGKLLYLGSGRHREVYLSPSSKTVIKVPICFDGIEANWSERFAYTGKIKVKGVPKVNLASCRMIGPNILIMTKVDIKELPSNGWIKYVDCWQVGYHPRTGKIVAFDYASF